MKSADCYMFCLIFNAHLCLYWTFSLFVGDHPFLYAFLFTAALAGAVLSYKNWRDTDHATD